VVSGDANAAAAAKDKVKNTVEYENSKRVDNDKRTTTPYMTKYERARVLGTRALQIRFVRICLDSSGQGANTATVETLPFSSTLKV
jgi:hypothetical protein